MGGGQGRRRRQQLWCRQQRRRAAAPLAALALLVLAAAAMAAAPASAAKVARATSVRQVGGGGGGRGGSSTTTSSTSSSSTSNNNNNNNNPNNTPDNTITTTTTITSNTDAGDDPALTKSSVAVIRRPAASLLGRAGDGNNGDVQVTAGYSALVELVVSRPSGGYATYGGRSGSRIRYSLPGCPADASRSAVAAKVTREMERALQGACPGLALAPRGCTMRRPTLQVWSFYAGNVCADLTRLRAVLDGKRNLCGGGNGGNGNSSGDLRQFCRTQSSLLQQQQAAAASRPRVVGTISQAAGSCSNGVQDGDETDVDCGAVCRVVPGSPPRRVRIAPIDSGPRTSTSSTTGRAVFGLCAAGKQCRGNEDCDADAGAGCVAGVCTATCASFSCPPGKVPVDNAANVACARGLCQASTDEGRCCRAKTVATCASYPSATACDAATEVPASGSTPCAAEACDAVADHAACCLKRSACAAYGGCRAGLEELVPTNYCAGPVCTSADAAVCCRVTNQAPESTWGRCADFTGCAAAGQQPVAFVSKARCPLGPCTVQDCCVPPDTANAPVVSAGDVVTCAANVPSPTGAFASCWGTNTFQQLGVDGASDTLRTALPETPVTDLVTTGGLRTVTAGATAVFAAGGASDMGALTSWGAVVPRATLIAANIDPDHVLKPNRIQAESAAVLGIGSDSKADTLAATVSVWSIPWWYEDKIPQPMPTPDAVEIVDVRASVFLGPGAENGTLACGLAKGGAARYCWGGGGRSGAAANANGGKQPLYLASPSVLPPGVSRIVAHDVSPTHSCIVGDNGKAYCSGDNGSGQLGAGAAAGAATNAYVEVKLSAAGSAITSVPTTLPRAVCTGRAHTCILSQDGVPHCFGDGSNGKLGNGAAGSSSVPVPVTMPDDQQAWAFVALSCGRDYTCALDQQGHAYCWGDNSDGQLGLGAAAAGQAVAVPTAVVDDASGAFQQLSTGSRHACGVSRATGSVYCWGRGAEGQLGLGRDYLTESPLRDWAQPQALPALSY